MQALKTMSDVRYESYSEDVEVATAALSVYAEIGRVTIKTHTLPRVEVEARLRHVDLKVWQENGCVNVLAESQSGLHREAMQQRKAQIVITVPATCCTTAQVVTGALKVCDLKAATRTHVITGPTTLGNLHGPIHATTVTGSIEYGGVLPQGTHRFASTTGSVRLALSEPPDARVYAWATTGHVQCAWPLSAQRRGGYLTGDHLYGVAGKGEGRVIAEVVTGSVQLGLSDA